MRHQDPLNPMDGTQFTAQLAQYSSLEQLVNLNTKLEQLNASQAEVSRGQALDYIGKEIVAGGNLLTLEDEGQATGGFGIDEDAECIARVSDVDGNLISLISLGNRKAGSHTFTWDGKTMDGADAAPGVYRFEVEGINADGETVKGDAQVSGLVSRVNMEGAEPLLYVGQIPVALSEVVDIRSSTNS
jgi:flagellar basal-body rod modification protein FlgD